MKESTNHSDHRQHGLDLLRHIANVRQILDSTHQLQDIMELICDHVSKAFQSPCVEKMLLHPAHKMGIRLQDIGTFTQRGPDKQAPRKSGKLFFRLRQNFPQESSRNAQRQRAVWALRKSEAFRLSSVEGRNRFEGSNDRFDDGSGTGGWTWESAVGMYSFGITGFARRVQCYWLEKEEILHRKVVGKRLIIDCSGGSRFPFRKPQHHLRRKNWDPHMDLRPL